MTDRGPSYGRYSLEPLEVPRVETAHRKIVTAQPAPGAVEVLERLNVSEPVWMSCQPPVLWDRAEGYSVEDRFGNRWIDWSSCVLVANAGHAPPAVQARVREAIEKSALPAEFWGGTQRRFFAAAPMGIGPVGPRAL